MLPLCRSAPGEEERAGGVTSGCTRPGSPLSAAVLFSQRANGGRGRQRHRVCDVKIAALG